MFDQCQSNWKSLSNIKNLSSRSLLLLNNLVFNVGQMLRKNLGDPLGHTLYPNFRSWFRFLAVMDFVLFSSNLVFNIGQTLWRCHAFVKTWVIPWAIRYFPTFPFSLMIAWPIADILWARTADPSRFGPYGTSKKARISTSPTQIPF